MSESGDYSSSGYVSSHDFTSARTHFRDVHVGRSFDAAVTAGKRSADLVPKRLSTNSSAPLILLYDVTGSMGQRPGVMFSKAPYIIHEARTEYLGADAAIGVGAFGDAHGDTYPLQMHKTFIDCTIRDPSDVAKRTEELKAAHTALVIEGGGGGQIMESAELAAIYLARNVDMPNAVRPICVFITDEKPYDAVERAQAAAHAHVALEGDLPVEQVFAELKRKFAVYAIVLTYGGGGDGGTTRAVRQRWTELLGADHIAALQDPERIVDVLFGILAQEAGRVDYFRAELEERQLGDAGGTKKVATVYTALKTIHKLPAKASATRSGRSVMHGVDDAPDGDDLA